MAYMDSIVEDEDDMTNYLSVNMKDAESRDEESPQKSYNTLASQLLSPPKPAKTPPAQLTPTASVANTPENIPPPPYPPLTPDSTSRQQGCTTRSLCNSVTTAPNITYQSIVSQVLSGSKGAIVRAKTSNHTYDGRITRSSIKRMAVNQD